MGTGFFGFGLKMRSCGTSGGFVSMTWTETATCKEFLQVRTESGRVWGNPRSGSYEKFAGRRVFSRFELSNAV